MKNITIAVLMILNIIVAVALIATPNDPGKYQALDDLICAEDDYKAIDINGKIGCFHHETVENN